MDTLGGARPLRLLLLLALLPPLRGQDLSVEECCDKGVEWANKNRLCASLPLISESRECSMTQAQCCRSQLEKQSCSDGVEFANVREECDSHIDKNSTCEAEYFKREFGDQADGSSEQTIPLEKHYSVSQTSYSRDCFVAGHAEAAMHLSTSHPRSETGTTGPPLPKEEPRGGWHSEGGGGVLPP
ncbi:fibulin-1-like [Catharus ustulatus]|uniref:fibulin-1-like n=1 Tax=Catharus ustulatus TaxID=91951 RepID=UPI00140723F3|nr:fibulin-1-like [Catharus ustulatus]